jgi:hypothetical protein
VVRVVRYRVDSGPIVAFVDHPSDIFHQEVELDFFGTVSSSLGQTTIVILGSLQTCSAAL